LQHAIATINANAADRKIQFVVITGDITNNGTFPPLRTLYGVSLSF
jgi:hypothetical protein